MDSKILWGIGVLSGLSYAAAAVSCARGVAALLFRDWMPGLRRVALGVIGALALMPAMALVAVGLSSRVDAAHKARVLGHAISAQMNGGVLGALLGLALGGVLEWRTRRGRKA